MAGRPWGFWTKQKLDLLSTYLDAFTVASKRAGKTVYLDLFAGQADNILKETGTRIDGSPIRAMKAQPPLDRVVLFELPHKAAEIQRDLNEKFPNRVADVTVWPGDCNETIDVALRDLAARDLNWAPTFAFIDQQGADVTWATLTKLARHRRSAKYKTELWMFFGHALLPRALSDRRPNNEFVVRMNQMLGTTEWHGSLRAWMSGDLTGRQFRDELLNWMRWRLETELGYQWTHWFELRNTNNQPIYAMIFATDNAAGNSIMSDLYGVAAREYPLMLKEARQLRARAKGGEQRELALNLTDGLVLPAEELYTLTRPTRPFGLDEYEELEPYA